MGIDASATHIAFVSLLGNEFSVTVSKNLGKSGPEACYNARVLTHETLDTVKKWAGDSAIVHAFYELPVLGRGGFRSTAVQCFTSGSVQGVLHERKCKTYPVNVSSWKKQVVGRGNADKGQVGEYLRCGWPSIHRAAHGNQDVYDASCIAIYGRQLLESRMEEAG
jgi:hypothetical protein